jgi:hypothetical protein
MAIEWKIAFFKEALQKTRTWLTSPKRYYRSLFDMQAEGKEAQPAFDADDLRTIMEAADKALVEKPNNPGVRRKRDWAAAAWRDARFATAGHRFLLCQGAHGRMRAHYDTGCQADKT